MDYRLYCEKNKNVSGLCVRVQNIPSGIFACVFMVRDFMIPCVVKVAECNWLINYCIQTLLPHRVFTLFVKL